MHLHVVLNTMLARLSTFFFWLGFFTIGFSDRTNAVGFVYNGFRPGNINLDGITELTENGLLMVTNNSRYNTGHAFYPNPITFKNSSNGSAFSFSTSFVFAIRCPYGVNMSADGLAFFIAPSKVLPGGRTFEFLGVFNRTTNGSSANQILAVEIDTFLNTDTNDKDENHVGIDVNTINSVQQHPAGFYSDDGDSVMFNNLTLASGDPIRVWVEYDGFRKEMNVTLAPAKAPKPKIPVLSLTSDLSLIFGETMYVGFAASTGPVLTNHYILGWSFGSGGDPAPVLDISMLPTLPRLGPKKTSGFLALGLPLVCTVTTLIIVIIITFYVRKKQMYAEVLEDWEVKYKPHRFSFKDLYIATKGFGEAEFLGAGGFGSVYKGTLPRSERQIAVKRVSHDSKQGIREFVSEIVSIGRMSHRNLVPLLGYCRRKGELLLVYEYMSNGSLDSFLYKQGKVTLSWSQRFKIIKGVASGLFYLHQGWDQVVVHRDIKASNVLLDGEMNPRVGDFGLAKLYDHGSDPQTTHVVGTVGYLAPEHYKTGRATTSTDVYAFGAFLLEMVCGKRPIQPWALRSEDSILVEWVYRVWTEGRVLEAVDSNLGGDFDEDEAELVLKLGLMCASAKPAGRPSMQKVLLYLDGSVSLPEMSSLRIAVSRITSAYVGDVSKLMSDYSSSNGNGSPQFTRVDQETILSVGR